MIAPDWFLKEDPQASRVLEGLFTSSQIAYRNKQGYNVYWLPNHPIEYAGDETINGTHVDKFDYVFVDFDLKDKGYTSKEAFVEHVISECPAPTTIVDSGNGVHAYWKVSDLDAISYLRLSRRFMRLLKTDEAVGQLFQLMRLPETWNTKSKENKHWCFKLHDSETEYSCEDLDKFLPAITLDDEKYCQTHYDQTYNIATLDLTVDYKIPPKFGKLISSNKEIKRIWAGDSDDRSRDDYRLGHVMYANDFTKEEAMSVLVNSSKAMSRAPVHRLNYARNIIEKIWTYEKAEGKEELTLSSSVESILKKSVDVIKGTPFRCHPWIDNTAHGFRLGHVLGLVAGVGVGKTSLALNLFKWFAEKNPDYHHMFIPLEQPSGEIANRWSTMCEGNTALNSKIHIMSNYDDSGNYRNLSLDEIAEYVLKWQSQTTNKIGCIVIDHIGVLKKKGSNDENQDLITLCQNMKAFAVKTNTFLVMQSQTNREKAGIGDLELNKDAAYGTVNFEAYCDYLVTAWQPLKRTYKEPTCPTVTAYKFCKIRHKNSKNDVIQEDVPYYLYFDPNKEQLRDLTETEEKQFKYFLSKSTNLRKLDRKTDLVEYRSVSKQGSM